MTLPHLPRGPENSSSSAPYWHYLVILVIPAVLWLINPNWLFQNLGHTDPWYYFGEFWHFPHFQSLLPTYAGERMTWIVPGTEKVIPYGLFLGEVVNFLILALVLFLFIVKFLGWIMRTKKEAPPPPLTKDQELLIEIRDLLKNQT